MLVPESDFYGRVAELLERGTPFVVCRITSAVGSVPRNPGAQLLVFPDGKIEFTLGGGAIEARVIREAVLSFEHERAFVRQYHLGDLGMHCGGLMSVAFERSCVADLPFYRQAQTWVERRTPFVAAYALEGQAQPLDKALLAQDERAFGPKPFVTSVREDVERMGQAGALETARLFVHRVSPPLRLQIFGAGHVGARLARVARATGIFSVDVVDDREAFANAERLPFAHHITVAEPNYAANLPLPDERTFVAVITRCHATDKVVLQTLLGSGRPFAYLGMIGSVSKRARLFRLLQDEGVDRSLLDQVVSPMGLPIGGKDPGEIALSMLAEIVQRKNELDGTLGGSIVRWKNRQQLQTHT